MANGVVADGAAVECGATECGATEWGAAAWDVAEEAGASHDAAPPPPPSPPTPTPPDLKPGLSPGLSVDVSVDPLLLDGCRVQLLWPQTKAGEVKLRQRMGLVHFRAPPLPAGGTRAAGEAAREAAGEGAGEGGGKAYVVLVERRSGAPPRERPVSWRTLAARSLVVLASPRAPAVGPWSARERAAARARLGAGEPAASIALSLGRSEAAMRDELRLGGCEDEGLRGV